MPHLVPVPNSDKFRAYDESGRILAEGTLQVEFIPDVPGQHILETKFVTDASDPANIAERERLMAEAARVSG
jgi:hypothetical protein